MLFNHKHRYLFIFLLAVYTHLNTELCQVYTHFQIDINWYHAFLIILLITTGVWEINRLLSPFFIKWFPGYNHIIRRSILFFASGLIAGYMITIIIDLFFSEIVLHELSPSIVNPLKLTLIYTSLINLLFHLLNLVFVYQTEYRNKILEAEELKRMHTQAELQAIKQQINPHFLFNNLNVLSGLVMQQSANANLFIEAFSKVYMHILNNHHKELIAVEDEIDFLEPYIFLLKQRFGESLQMDIAVPEKYKNHYIIPVSLQMLVENAIKHNILSQKKPLHIKIYANGSSTISVINNLQPKINYDVAALHTGLTNIRKRYEIITGKSIAVEKDNFSFAVTLPLIEIKEHEHTDYRR